MAFLDVFDFSGKTAVVTGGGGVGGGGTGRAVCERFAECGAKVAVLDTDGIAAKAAADGIRASLGSAIALECDICDDQSVRHALARASQEFGGIDILVNNAFWHDDVQPQVADCTIEDWDRHVEINLRAQFIVIRQALPYLLKNQESVIVNISSTGAHRGEDGYAAYSAAKAGLESLTRSLAAQYGRQGLRCNSVVPGLVLTSAMDEYAASDPVAGKMFSLIDRNMLLDKAHGTGDDVAYAVLFLASRGAKYVTAQSLIVDGGTVSHFPQWADQREFFAGLTK